MNVCRTRFDNFKKFIDELSLQYPLFEFNSKLKSVSMLEFLVGVSSYYKQEMTIEQIEEKFKIKLQQFLPVDKDKLRRYFNYFLEISQTI